MVVHVAINGFGRIGRNVVRAIYESRRFTEIVVVAINELADDDAIAYLLKYDTTHGRFTWDVRQEQGNLFIGKDSIFIFHEKNVEVLPWRELNIDIVLDCTGTYSNRRYGELHLIAGAKKVLFSQLGASDLDATIIYGVNHQILNPHHSIISNASCTTNCIIPIIKILNDAYEIDLGTITTIHSAMHDQPVIDSYRYDLRRNRSASQSIVPVETRLISGITRIFPQFNNRFEAISVRVPTINVIAIDLSVIVKKPVLACCEVNLLFQEAAQNIFKGIVSYIELPLVSVDFNHNPHSVIVDGTQTRVSGSHLIKVLLWCDNEWGFANRMLDTTLVMAACGFR